MSMVGELTDLELSRRLEKLGYAHPPVTSTTRGVLERKLAQLLNTSVAFNDETLATVNSVTTTADISLQEEDKSNGCYLLVYSGEIPNGITLKKCYYSKQELDNVLKSLKGARFKWFSSEEEAIAASHDLQVLTENVVDGSSNKESASLFPSLSTVSLNKFRELIEDGYIEEFSKCVWSNPRYLVSSGDAPEVLKPSTRYNAMHVAVRSNRLKMCEEIIAIIESTDFWNKLYPEDTMESRLKRKLHLLDLYFNIPDRIANETPLHFACKCGYEDIVELLLGRQEVDRRVKNSAGMTAREIICQRNGQDSVAKKIDKLFEDVCYVPVYRSVDNSVAPLLGTPCSLEDCHSPPTHCNSPLSPINLSLVGRAFAGPMSPAKAKDFRKRWRSPGNKAFELIRRSDADKGLERVGRHLAYHDKTHWSEYWEFLGNFCDLAKPDGLGRLEQYLQERHRLSHEVEESEDPLLRSCGDKKTARNTLSQESIAEKKELFPPDSDVSMVTSQLSNISLQDSSPVLSPKIFMTGSLPTKLDYDVMLAIDDARPDLTDFPKVKRWHTLVNSYSHEDRTSWRTPRKSRPFCSPHIAAATTSPLVYRTPVQYDHATSS